MRMDCNWYSQLCVKSKREWLRANHLVSPTCVVEEEKWKEWKAGAAYGDEVHAKMGGGGVVVLNSP